MNPTSEAISNLEPEQWDMVIQPQRSLFDLRLGELWRYKDLVMLFVRRERIRDVWPLMAAGPELDGDIRKFEEIGTHPVGVRLAIAEAIAFHRGIGPARKEARLRFLRDRWARRIEGVGNARLWTSLAPGRSTGVALVEIAGVTPARLQEHLWTKHRIYTVGIDHARFRGVRVSPHVCTTVHEVDRFGDVLEKVAREGLPV